ncbi:translationally-controlled tumor protein homolog [Solea solea]|uniref:translationally-controlled tumor protein homolog n=1 Tax=Solea solea TaxID=90069 RepID=UPI00272991D4|nr:translationally-controlled tumor protein homolog [Solea solea]
MLVYVDIISGDEMFSDALKIIDKGFLIEVEGKTVTRSDVLDESKIGANKSAEEVEEASEMGSVSGCDIILNHKLQKTGFDKKQYTTYVKNYVKQLKEKLLESNPDRVNDFMKEAPAAVAQLLKNFKNFDFYTGESSDSEGMVGLLDYREDGVTPYMVFFKDGLRIEKF